MKRFRLIVVLSLVLSLVALPASAAPTYTQLSLTATVDGTAVTASVAVQASMSTKVDRFGVCVRTSSGAGADYPLAATTITVGGTSWSAVKSFPVGTYAYFGCLRVNGRWSEVGARKTFSVVDVSAPAPSPTPVPAPAPRPDPAPAGYWTADLAGVPVGSLGCRVGDKTSTGAALAKQWDYWDSCGGTVVSPTAEGIPHAPGSTANVVKWTKPAGSDQVYQKLNRTWTSANWPRGGCCAAPDTATHSPADVSGIYSAYLYIPKAQFVFGKHGWVQLLQFKENYRDTNGKWHQDPTWAIGMNNFSGRSIGGGLWPDNTHTFTLDQVADRWVQFQMRLYQGDRDTTGHGGRVEMWIDGKLMQTGYESERHVGSGAYAPLSRTESWIFPVGAYTSNQTTNGQPDSASTHTVLYVGPSSLTPLPR